MAILVDVIGQRHGEKEQGQDPSLTELGRKQVKAALERLGVQGIQLDLAINSGTLRTRQTCKVAGTVVQFLKKPEVNKDFGFSWVEDPMLPQFPWDEVMQTMDKEGIRNPSVHDVLRLWPPAWGIRERVAEAILWHCRHLVYTNGTAQSDSGLRIYIASHSPTIELAVGINQLDFPTLSPGSIVRYSVEVKDGTSRFYAAATHLPCPAVDYKGP